ncbi:MAG: polyribonucleotide nucleotidyltransferase [Campylobacterota bacterium]|nr:polyribonucleotide nucleotidyltransferase [Campylobacterota bacterium]
MRYDVAIELVNKVEEYSFNEVARQANGAAWLRSGNSVILATVVSDSTQMVDEDFLPLTVQYIEKTYAAGKFPGGFFKRETKPSDFETLTSRIVDRSLRPLFPKGFANPIQISIIVFSADKEADLQVLALNAASAALYVSDLDISTSVTAMRVGKVGGELIFNPTMTQMEDSTLDLYLSGSKSDMLMIEMRSLGSDDVDVTMATIEPTLDTTIMNETIITHSANCIGEDEMIEILDATMQNLTIANGAYESQFSKFAAPVSELKCKITTINEEIKSYVKENFSEKISLAINKMAKSERSTALLDIANEIVLIKVDYDKDEIFKAVESVKRDTVRGQILTQKVRADGRSLDEVRPIDIKTNVLPSAHASAIFTRGQTQALVILTLGNERDAQMYEDLQSDETQNENFMVHYNFPGFSVGEPSPIGAPRRRELGHGNLGKRSLESSISTNPGTIRLVSEILESNGSSSMATVCGGYMALRSADIEMSETIAGIAMGMVSENGKYAILSDIMGLEDHDGDMDFKVAGSKNGISALQMDIKLGGISLDVLKEALHQAKKGRSHIIDIMLDAESNIELNDGVLPTSHTFGIDPSSVGEIIGQAGKTIREIIEKFSVSIDIDKKKGDVKITSKNRQSIQDAKDHIENVVLGEAKEKIEYNVGDCVVGTVKKIVDFGAFIGLPGGIDGLLHISKISNERVNRVADVISEGEEIKVEILEFKGNKISLGRAK